jgi:transcriptional regulator with XRE-family HTH domain
MSMKFGARLRELRKKRGMSLAQVAQGAALSRSFISQVESDQTTPSIASIKRICDVLGASLAQLFDDETDTDSADPHPHGDRPAEPAEPARVVRKNRRKAFKYPGAKSMNYLLVPDLQGRLEVILGVMQPGETSESEAWTHDGEEFGFILEGTYELTVGGRSYILEEGDSIYFSSRLAHSAKVIGDRPVRWIWVITPPSF